MNKLINWFKQRSSFISILVLLIAIPLYPKFPLQEISGTWVAIRVDDILVLSVLFVWLIKQLLSKFPVRSKKIFWFFILFWLIGLLSSLSAIFITDFVNPKLVLLHWARRIEYMCLFLIALDSVKSKKDFKIFVWAIAVTLLAVYFVGYGQKKWGFPVISTMNEEFSKGLILKIDVWTRISSTFAGHYDLAVWLILIFSLLPTLVLFFKNWWQKIIIVICFILSFHLLTLTASRVSFAAYLIAISCSLLLLKKYWWLPPILLISLFFGFQSKELSARLASSVETIPIVNQINWQNFKQISLKKEKEEPEPTPTIVEPIPTKAKASTTPRIIKVTPVPTKILKEARTWPTPEEAAVAAARSSSIRFQVEWPRAIRAFAKNPILGTGYSSVGLATDNDYLRALAEVGLIGTLSLGLILITIFNQGIRALKSKNNRILGAALISIIIGFCSNAVFIDVFEASKVAFYFWMLLGIFYQLLNLEKDD